MSYRSFHRLGLTGALLMAGPAALAQTSHVSPREKPDARVAAFEVALYNAQANLQEASDSAKAGLATSILQAKLAELLPGQLVDAAALRSAAGTPDALASAQRQPCSVIVACARAAAAAAGARWVVMAKVSKTSNLIWLFTGQLIHVPSGAIILDDSTELKGEPEAMVRAGTRIFAERVARTIRAGGVTTDFPGVEGGRLGSQLRLGMKLLYASGDQSQPPWIVDSVRLSLPLRAGSDCAAIFLRRQPGQGKAEENRLCLARDTLYGWSAKRASWDVQRPVGPSMRVALARANGDTVHYETGTAGEETISGMTIPVVSTTVTTLDSLGRTRRRLRERYAITLATATGGTFESPDSARPGQWRTEQTFELREILP